MPMVVAEAAPPINAASEPEPSMTVADYGSEEHQWEIAVGSWFEGDGRMLASLVLSHSLPVPAHIRPLLADLVLGKAKKPRGRPPARPPASE